MFYITVHGAIFTSSRVTDFVTDIYPKAFLRKVDGRFVTWESDEVGFLGSKKVILKGLSVYPVMQVDFDLRGIEEGRYRLLQKEPIMPAGKTSIQQ